MKTKAQRKDDLILHMLRTFRRLGNDAMARIDARLWHEHYYLKVKRLGIVKKVKIIR